MRGLVCGVIAAMALACAGAPASAQAATVSIGQLFAPSGSCANFTIVQPAVASGPSYAVPAAGVITSWSFQTDAFTAPGLKLKIARAAGVGAYTVIAEAAAGAQMPSAVNTYPADIPVQAG